MAVLFPLFEMVWFLAAFLLLLFVGGGYVRAAALIYLANLALVLDGGPSRDGFSSPFWSNPAMHDFFRGLPCWRLATQYFGAEIVKTKELPVGNGESYLICYHPHGIIGMGLQCEFLVLVLLHLF